MRRMAIIGSAVLALTACATLAAAEEPDARDRGRVDSDRSARAPAQAFEATVGLGYTQGFGQIARGGANDVNDVANVGVGVDVGFSERLTPRLSLGFDAQYSEYSTGSTLDSSSSARGAAFDVNVQYHFAPFRRVDPWLKLGTGYRMLWQAPEQGANTLWHGLDLVKAQAGVDFRSTSSVALGPMVGADLDVFLWTKRDGVANTALADPRVSTFVYAGIQGRFESGGRRVEDATLPRSARRN